VKRICNRVEHGKIERMGISGRLVQLDWARYRDTPSKLGDTRRSLVVPGSRELPLEDRDWRELRTLLGMAKRGLERAIPENTVLEPSQVAKLSEMFLPWPEVAACHSPELMAMIGFHDSDADDLRDYYEELHALYREASQQGNAVYFDCD
jgi:hypothetical protein